MDWGRWIYVRKSAMIDQSYVLGAVKVGNTVCWFSLDFFNVRVK